MDADSRDRTLQDLRTIVEKVEQKAHVAPDNLDIVALRQIVEHRIIELVSEDDADSHSSNAP